MADKFNFNVFLSHNGKDKPAVENIARLLRDTYNLKAWLDKWNLVPGEAWQEGLEDALDDCQTVAVFLGPSGIGPWENEEMRSAISDRVQDKSRRVIPVLLPGAPDNKDLELPRFLKRATWVDFRSGLDDKESLYRLYCGITGQAPGDQTFKPSNLKPETPSRDTWHLAHPYPMPPNFTGRVAEQQMLDGWLADDKDRLFILRALGGFGKSALTWQWINTHVNPAEWTKLVWWSFYEGDASFEHFIEETLKYLKLEIPQGQRPQVDELLKAMQSQKILLTIDGFERALRAYSSMNAAYQGDEPKIEDNQLDCVNINAEIFLKGVCSLPNIKSKVLMTTRLTPRAVKPHGEFMLGCREVELTAMQKADAVEFFKKQKIKGTHAEIEATCVPYGYHPLSLRLLAGRILKDFENPADIVVAQKLKIDGDVIQQKHHVLEVSYNSLLPHEQKLLSTIACFRSPVELKTLEAIAENKNTLNDDLRDLVERGLLHFDDKNKKFDLHPIVRQYTYERLTAADRTAAHTRLMNYFESMPEPAKVVRLEDLASVIELYFHTVQVGWLDSATEIFYYQLEAIISDFGAYQTGIELLSMLFEDGIDKLPQLDNEMAQAWALNGLANCYSMIGRPRHAINLYEQKNKIHNLLGDTRNLLVGLWNKAYQEFSIGKMRAAHIDFSNAMDLARSDLDKIMCNRELGKLLMYQGEWEEANQNLLTALQTVSAEEQSIVAYQALLALLTARYDPVLETKQFRIALDLANHAHQLTKQKNATERELVQVYWILGVSLRSNNQLQEADTQLNEALQRCRIINVVVDEADILLDLARLRYNQKKYEEAKSLAEEALTITERCGYVLQGADVNLFLAQYALEQEQDKAKAKQYAEEAKKLATCDGPPYYYKVAYEEAERMLERLKDGG